MTQTLELSAGAQAFGDGTHPTTRGVLAALEMLDPAAFTPRHACDMGAGSGILSFAILQQFQCPVIAVEIEKTAVSILAENARANGVALDGAGGNFRPLHANGFAHPEIARAAPFDLITMNILAEPLLRLAGAATQHLAEGGVLIVSGLLTWQEAQISDAYQSLSLELTARLTVGDWVTQVWQKP